MSCLQNSTIDVKMKNLRRSLRIQNAIKKKKMMLLLSEALQALPKTNVPKKRRRRVRKRSKKTSGPSANGARDKNLKNTSRKKKPVPSTNTGSNLIAVDANASMLPTVPQTTTSASAASSIDFELLQSTHNFNPALLLTNSIAITVDELPELIRQRIDAENELAAAYERVLQIHEGHNAHNFHVPFSPTNIVVKPRNQEVPDNPVYENNFGFDELPADFEDIVLDPGLGLNLELDQLLEMYL